jgi:MFS family permease
MSRSSPSGTAALLGVTAALALFGLAQGLSYPLFTLLMQGQGMPSSLIGLSAAMMPIGLTLSAGFVPIAVRKLGARNLAVLCALCGAVLFVLIGVLQNWVGWFLLRFLLGLVINPLYVLGEVWALALAPPERRGRVMGIFNALMGAGYASGPLALAAVGTQGAAPFAIAVCGFFACAVVLWLVSGGLSGFEPEEGAAGGVMAFAPLAPALLVAVLVAAATQQSTYALMPVFGAAYGLREGTLAALVTALSAGNIVLQIPLGLGAERWGARTMILTCSITTAACALSLPWLIGTPYVWPVLVTMGGVGYGTYTMALIELGTRFRGQSLVAGNAAFALMWGAGGIVGPPVAGTLMQSIGPAGLPAVIVVLSVGLVSFATYRARVRSRT